MVDEALTGAKRAYAKFAMRFFPVLPAAMAAAITLAAPQAAHADSPVTIEGVDDDMRDTLRELLPDRERPTSLFDAERIAEEASDRATAWLRSEGYYAATVTPEATEEPPAARLIIEAGPRFSLTAPTLEYEGAPPIATADAEVRQALAGVTPGAPARAVTVLEAEANAVTALQRSGYADAAAAPRRVVVDHAATTMSPEYRLSPGAQAFLGDVRVEPAGIFRPGFVEDLQNWDDGDVYTPEALARLRRDLSSTGAVSRITTRLGEPDENGLRDVVLDIEPARRHAYELGVSWSTNEGFGVIGEWTRRNLTGRADSLSVEARLAELQQGVSVELTRPHAAGLGHAVNFGASVDREDLAAYTRQGVALYASVDASNRLKLARSYGLRLSADNYDDVSGTIEDAVVLSAFGEIRRDTTEFSLDPRDGSIVTLRLEPSVSAGDTTLGFVRGIAEVRAYESFGREDSFTLAARIRSGWLQPVSGSADDAPPDRRFYAGGGGSVRGYEFNSIYPLERDALGLTPGGQGALDGSIEARWRFTPTWGAVAFVDAGTAFDDWADAGDLSVGVGVGLRYDLGFAPLRFDVAIPLDDEFSTDDYALYISLGQAF